MACIVTHMTPSEALAAATINAAAALGRAHIQGSLEAGKLADMVVLNVPRYVCARLVPMLIIINYDFFGRSKCTLVCLNIIMTALNILFIFITFYHFSAPFLFSFSFSS